MRTKQCIVIVKQTAGGSMLLDLAKDVVRMSKHFRTVTQIENLPFQPTSCCGPREMNLELSRAKEVQKNTDQTT